MIVAGFIVVGGLLLWRYLAARNKAISIYKDYAKLWRDYERKTR
jgi:hypothetical protein